MTANDNTSGQPASRLRQAYTRNKDLLHAQSAATRNALLLQANNLASAILEHSPTIRFTLPEQVSTLEGTVLAVPAALRQQGTGRTIPWPYALPACTRLADKLEELAGSPDVAIALSAELLRYSLAHFLVYTRLPDGHSVTYHGPAGEPPSEPVDDPAPSATTAASDAIADDRPGSEFVQVPFTAYARRFFLPQWVAFGEKDELLAGSTLEAEAAIASMQKYLEVLNMAVEISAYIAADEAYQRKRYGMLGQLINQGRALGRHQTRETIAKLEQRARDHSLNRGVSISLPYFNDREFTMGVREIEIVPGGLIPFIRAFVVRAVRLESARVVQDLELNPSTRFHLLKQLEMLEKAFRHSQEK